jgi:site-specific DNA recombinase
VPAPLTGEPLANKRRTVRMAQHTHTRQARRAVLYARVSIEEQARRGYSLAQQLEALREHAGREGYEVLAEVGDEAQSGASLDRPGLDGIRDLVAAGGVSVVLAQDRDRFAREPAHHYLLRREFEEHGCKLRALNNRGDDTPEGELTDGIMDQLAKYERAKTAERTRRGRLRKAREGKVPGNGTPDYGFCFNEARDGYRVNPATMPLVGRILRLVGEEGTPIRGVAGALNREGVPAPNGGRWNTTFVRNVIRDDVYRAHPYAEISSLVAPEVAARLDPEGRYGVYWYNKVKREQWQVGEAGPGGERLYRARSRTVPKPREEWIAVPVPDPGIPREVVDAAREAVEGNKKTSSAGSRFWELSGGVARCEECDRALTPRSQKRRQSGKTDTYYACPRHLEGRGCPNRKYHRAEVLETRVREAVASLLGDPEKMIAHVQERIEQMSRRDPEREAKALAGRISELDKKLSRAQDLAIEGLIGTEDLRKKAASIRAEREDAVRELGALEEARDTIAALKRRWKNALVPFAFGLRSGLRHLSAEERHATYKRLGLKVRVAPDGATRIEGDLDANALPRDEDQASGVAQAVEEEMKEQGIVGIMIKDPPPDPRRGRAHVGEWFWEPTGRRTKTTMTRPSR